MLFTFHLFYVENGPYYHGELEFFKCKTIRVKPHLGPLCEPTLYWTEISGIWIYFTKIHCLAQWSQVRFHPNGLALEKFQLPMIVRSIPYLKQLKTKSHNEGFQRKSNFRFLLYEEFLKIWQFWLVFCHLHSKYQK